MRSDQALVIFSGGQDSTTCLAQAVRDYGEGNVYDVAAFTLDGKVPEEIISELKQQAEALTDRVNLRAHGYVYTCLEPWDGGGTIWISKKPEFRALSRPEQGVYVIPIQRLTSTGEPRWLAWAREGDQLNIAIVYKP